MNPSSKTATHVLTLFAAVLLMPNVGTSQTTLMLSEPSVMAECAGNDPKPKHIRLQGLVLQSDGRSPIAGATVSVKRTNSQSSTMSKSDGQYCIEMEEGPLLTKVEYSYAKLSSTIRNLSGEKNHTINKVLLPTEQLSLAEKRELQIAFEEDLGLEPENKSAGGLQSTWTLLPKKVCKDNFGGRVAGTYHCVKVTLSNSSRTDSMQAVAVGFTIPGLADNLRQQIGSIDPNDLSGIQSVNYNIVRGSLERGAEESTRNLTIRSLKALGSVLTGVTPFFHVPTHRSNFLQIANLISNPIESGIELIFPDRTMRDLRNLEHAILREGQLLPPGSDFTAIVFMPKELLNVNKKDETPRAVVKALGELVVVSDRLRPIDRERTVSGRGYITRN